MVTLSGCGKDPDMQDEQAATVDENAVKEQAIKEVVDGEAGELYTGIAQGKKMKCEYTLEMPDTEETKVVIYLDGMKYRTEIQAESMNPERVIFDGEAMYSWDDTMKQGMKMDMNCMEEFEQIVGDQAFDEELGVFDPASEDFVKDLPDMQCEEVGEVDLSIPDDVEFMDQCEMLREQFGEEE